MIIFHQAADLSAYLDARRQEGLSIGFAPTMGALHNGHISLIEASRKNHDLTVCSIFVNPTQFNNAEDFKHYPVTIGKDIEALTAAGTDVLFLPSVQEIYPADYQKKHYELGPLETVWEGAHRPGHFQGVCQVVERLLEIVRPRTLILGQKDFQQCMVLRRLIGIIGNATAVTRLGAPTLREADGLAMSSRNLRLSPEQRIRATAIYRELQKIAGEWKTQPAGELEAAATHALEASGFVVDYVAIVRQEDLVPIQETGEPAVVLAAAALGPVRLIDNLPLH